jgi:hypothetical protein
MPKCRLCNTDVLSMDDLRVVLVDKSRYNFACSVCISRLGLEADPEEVRNVPVRLSDGSEGSSGEINEKAFSSLKDILNKYEEDREVLLKKKERKSYKRQHERWDAAYEVDFSYLRDDVVFPAQTLDFSVGGMSFKCEFDVGLRSVLRTKVHYPKEGEKEQYVEVRRCVLANDGMYHVGCRFLKRIGVEDVNRRKHKRKNFSGAVFFRREQSEITIKGYGLNLSKDGMAMVSHDEIINNESISVSFRTAPPEFPLVDFVGKFKVLRVEKKELHEFVLSGKFTSIRANPVHLKKS